MRFKEKALLFSNKTAQTNPVRLHLQSHAPIQITENAHRRDVRQMFTSHQSISFILSRRAGCVKVSWRQPAYFVDCCRGIISLSFSRDTKLTSGGGCTNGWQAV